MVNDEFETLAQRFYEDTGIMAPGKNVHPAMGGGFLVSQEYRWARWTEWLRSRAESRESKHREVGNENLR